MSDRELIERLRSSAKAFRKHPIYTSDGDPVLLTVQADECDAAADRLEAQAAEIERLTVDGIHTCHDQCARPACVLRRENTRLREALGPFAREADNHDRPDIADHDRFGGDICFGDFRRARQALQQGQNNE